MNLLPTSKDHMVCVPFSDALSLKKYHTSRCFSVRLEFGLEDFDFKTRMFVVCSGWGFGDFFIAILFFGNNKIMY